MDKQIVESSVKIPNYLKDDERRRKLYLLDRWLDGTIYDDMPNPFHRDSKRNGGFISMEQRRPAAKWKLAGAASRILARKLVAGRHAPVFTCPEFPEVAEAAKKISDENGLLDMMQQAITLGQVGSVCATFKFLKNADGELKLVTDIYRSRDCWPVFDQTKDLFKLRICQPTMGNYFQLFGLNFDHEGEQINPAGQYWFIKEITRTEEIHFYPIGINLWKPDGLPDHEKMLKKVVDGEFKPFPHGLGFVPAQWFVNMSGGGGVFPDGKSTFEDALDNVVEYDYTMSQMGLGVKNSATPHVVFQGIPMQQLDGDGKPIPWSPTRYLQFPPTRKDDTHVTEGGDAHLLEPTGQGMSVGIKDYSRQIKKDGIEQIALSRKDPDKVTTAMSGKGMELIEEEFNDLVMDLRGCYLSVGFIRFMQKVGRAAIKALHPLFRNISPDSLKLLALDFPQMHDMSPSEYREFMTALSEGCDSGILDGGDAFDLHEAQVDSSAHSTREEVKARVESIRKEKLQSKQNQTTMPPKAKAKPKAGG